VARGKSEQDREASDDRLLLRRAQAGDAGAFTKLIGRHDRRLRALAFHVVGDREAMDDVMQEVYLKAFRALPTFKGRAAVATWLHRLTYNACIDELRRARRRLPTEPLDDDVVQPQADVPDSGDLLARRDELRAALMELTVGERGAVWLVDAMGFDYGEAATIMGLPAGTVGSRLSRARSALRRMLAPAETGTEP
jgi:RNA polymerase sigma-70 factor (ECF subfamily)